ncbi:MAG: DNA-3-methyladenine glycosylase [Acidimicrobiia bacterium]
MATRLVGKVLGRSFYAQDARKLAPLLLNKVLMHHDPDAGRLLVRIVEVEAYAGAEDPASHGYRGKTGRNATMFGPPGHLYVYFTYGMHWCANVVGGSEGIASGVLLRAAEPMTGVETMRTRRPAARQETELCSGPARLTQALGLTGDHDGTDLVRGVVRLLDDGMPPPRRPIATTRVGLRAGRGDEDRWRFFVPGNLNVSRGPKH